ncbi:MAG TPA: MFS transporter [Dictyobacter sp.]|jgi:DHA2 family methylenomycin A resistance protein-like MFS transporter|nr:MFS transporter [Dictyobacter sp.]
MSDRVTSPSSPVLEHMDVAGKPRPFFKMNSQTTQQILLISICLGWFMAALDNTIVNVALQSIGVSLQTDVTGLQWIVDSYALVYASILLTAGALGDRLGNKQMYLAGLLIFSAASALCGYTPAFWVLIVARTAQGLGAALMTPNTLALISKSFTDPQARARAIAFWAIVGGVAVTVGPMVGGFLVDTFGWRSIFFINVPIGIVAYLLTLRLVGKTTSPEKRPLDLSAQVAVILALGALTFVLIEGSKDGWSSPLIVGGIILFVVAGGIFLLIEQRGQAPMLPLHFFLIPTFSATTVVGLVLNFGYYGFIFLLSLFFEQLRGYSPLLTGLALLPMTASIILGNIMAGRLTGHSGPGLTMSLGIGSCGIGFLALAPVSTTTSYLVLFLVLLFTGFGMGLTVPSMTSALLGTVSRHHSGVASGVLNASRQVGGVLGVALFGALVQVNGSFVRGLHISAIIAGVAALLCSVLTWYAVHKHPQAEVE